MRVTVDDRRIGYDDTGGSRTPLVLLHGFPLDRTAWDDVVPALAGLRIVRVDLRGCGESDPSDGPALMEALAADVAGVLDALHIERAAIAGHSIGGYVALAFFRMYAERVAGLALIASHVSADATNAGMKADGDAAAEQRALARGRDDLARRLEAGGTMEPAVASYLPRYLAPHVYTDQPDLVARTRALMERQDPRGCAQLVRGMKERLDSHDLLADVDVPALIVAGAQDAYLDAQALRATAAAIAGARFLALDGVGHAPMLEAPAETASALVEFASCVAAGPGASR